MGIPSYARTSYCCIYATAAVLVYQASVMQDRCLFLFLRNIQQPTANRQPRYVVLAEASSLFHCARTNERTNERTGCCLDFLFQGADALSSIFNSPSTYSWQQGRGVVCEGDEKRKYVFFFKSSLTFQLNSPQLARVLHPQRPSGQAVATGVFPPPSPRRLRKIIQLLGTCTANAATT